MINRATRARVVNRLRAVHPRTVKALTNSFWGLVIKGSGIVVSFVSVPITFDYLDKTSYGVWLTLSSLLTLVSLLDIGIGNGLRNRFAEAVSKQDYQLARSYLSTAYLLFSGIQMGFVGVFALVNAFIPWNRVLNTTLQPETLHSAALITFVALGVRLVLDLLSYVLYALQQTARAGLIQLIANVLILGGVYAISRYSHGDLTKLAFITAVSPIAVLLFSSVLLYRTSLKVYRPRLTTIDRKHTRSLLSLGYKFFLIQIAVIIIFYTDNFIISQLFGPGEVATYNIAYRYFNLVNTVFVIVIAPFWSAITEAHVKADYGWMTTTYRRLRQLWIGVVAAVIGMIIVANYAYHLWLGDRISIPFLLTAFMGLSVIISCWNNVAVSVINGTGKVQLQLYSALLAAATNIPLAIVFGRYFQLGSAGVILATCVSLLLGSVIGTLQAGRILRQTATGIWNR